jgi:hypothetical protein
LNVFEPTPNEVPEFRIRVAGDEPKTGTEVESPTLPLPPPRDRDELDRLLHAVASTPSSDRQLIVDTVAGFSDRDAVAELLHEAVLDLPVQDVGRHLILLALVGELRHESSPVMLERFVWLSDEDILPPDSHIDPLSGEGGSACHFVAGGALQARAAEMLVWVTRGDYEEGVRRILDGHPSVQTRVATIDAYAYAANDNPQTLARLLELARDEDRWAVGLPRRTADVDPVEFAALVERRQTAIGSATELPDRPDSDDEEDGHVR